MADRDRSVLQFQHNGQTLRVTKSRAGGRTEVNAFLYDPVAGPVLLAGFRDGMTVGQVKDLAKACADELAEYRRRRGA